MSEPIIVAALTGGRTVPSARFRVGQYVQPMKAEGIDLRWLPAPIAKHPPRIRALRPLWLPLSMIGRIPGAAASYRADVTMTSRELVSTLVTLEPLLKKPYVLDVDDAIWLRRGGKFAERLGRMADIVVAGNAHVAEWFSQYCDRIEIIPTAVDTDRFTPAPPRGDGRLVIGWSGTSSNLPFLESLQPALRRIMDARPNVILKVSSDRPPRLNDLPAEKIEFEPWSVLQEVSFIRSLDVGLMPLADDAWSRGKCAFKMLLYLACGVAVVVSPIGMNRDLLAAAVVGRGATSEDSWVDAIIDLIDDPDLREKMGVDGRNLAVSSYSITSLTPRLADVFRQATLI